MRIGHRREIGGAGGRLLRKSEARSIRRFESGRKLNSHPSPFVLSLSILILILLLIPTEQAEAIERCGVDRCLSREGRSRSEIKIKIKSRIKIKITRTEEYLATGRRLTVGIEKYKCPEFRDGQYINAFVAIDVCRCHLHTDAGAVVDQVRRVPNRAV